MTGDTAAVIGLGLIGGSVGAALRRAGWTVHGFDRSRAVRTVAQSLGLVDLAAASLTDAIAGADAVILAIPLPAIISCLPLVDAAARGGALILDTGSAKVQVVEIMATLPGGHRAIGGHPLAGSERSGPEAATPDLFEDRPFALCPSLVSSSAAVTRAAALVTALGSRPVLLPAREHDHVLARTSHLPQLLSSALGLCLAADDARLSGPGLRDMTRLAASPAALWRDILSANQSQVALAMREFASHFETLAELIQNGRFDEVESHMERSASCVAALRGASW